eukprot:6078823-Pyramimonas_sp.AAC.2
MTWGGEGGASRATCRAPSAAASTFGHSSGSRLRWSRSGRDAAGTRRTTTGSVRGVCIVLTGDV